MGGKLLLHKCEDCKHCDVKTMKCRPESNDCHSEYDLTEEDLNTPDKCDFFESNQLKGDRKRW